MRASAPTPRAAGARKTTGTQYAALPYRVTEGGLEIMLITTRRTKRWIVPKGWPIEGCEPCACAAREALEEAGIVGEIQERPVGFYHYFKVLKNGISVPCKVDVFALRVTRQRKTWPEKDVREVRWYSFKDAVAAVGEPDLRRLIVKFGVHLAANGN